MVLQKRLVLYFSFRCICEMKYTDVKVKDGISVNMGL